jgi:hypothetical protein
MSKIIYFKIVSKEKFDLHVQKLTVSLVKFKKIAGVY